VGCSPRWRDAAASPRSSTGAARISDNISAIASGNPRRVARRAKNVTLGRALGRVGFWRWIWK
jgi:hypothetical protein